MSRSVNLRKEARGRECTVRIPGHCTFNPETSVLAHYRLAGTCGTGCKPDDLQGLLHVTDATMLSTVELKPMNTRTKNCA